MNLPFDAYILPIVLIGSSLIVAMVRWPKVWIGAFILYLPLFLSDTGRGLNARELAMGSFFTGTVVLWIIWSIGRPDRRLVRGWLDFLILLFIVLTAFNVVIAVINDVPLVGWISDYAVVNLMLYYFPIREYFSEERDLRQLLTLAGIAALLMAVFTVYNYRQRMLSGGLIYAFQLVASRSVLLAPLHLLAILFGAVGMFFSKWKAQVGITIMILANAIALFLSFGRTLWVFFFVCLLVAMVFLRWKQNVKLTATMLVSFGTAVAAVFIISPKLASIGTTIVRSRIESTTQLSGGDYSFETRIVESEAALKRIVRHPLGGTGMRSPFVSYYPIDRNHREASFVHIGYVGLAMRQGIPMLILMMAILIGFTIQSFRAAWMLTWDDHDRLYRLLAVVMLANMPSVYVNIFMAGVFDQRYGNVMFAFIFACIAIAHDYVQRRRPSLSNPV